MCAGLTTPFDKEGASTVVRERMAQERPADAALLQNVESADIVVVSGQYDEVEDVLESLCIKHTVVSPAQVGALIIDHAPDWLALKRR